LPLFEENARAALSCVPVERRRLERVFYFNIPLVRGAMRARGEHQF
jgi:hypothetical protein